MTIYKATNKINGKIYIGQTLQRLSDRIRNHKKASRTKNTYFCSALKKYGIDGFIWEEIDKANSLDELDFLEILWINLYISNSKEYGYNLRSGGTKGNRLNGDTISKIKEKFASGESIIWAKGKKFSEEHRQKISQGNKGKVFSKETKEKMSKNHADFKGEKNPRFGQNNYNVWLEKYGKEIADKKLEEWKKKQSVNSSGMANPMYGKVRSDVSKKVICIDTNITYNSISEAAELTNLHISGITMACKGKLKTSGGYKWKYVNN